jgi:enterochelin esterase-like enzyme
MQHSVTLKKACFLLVFAVMTACSSHPRQTTGLVDESDPNRTADASASSRIVRLGKELASGNRAALDQFWDEIQGAHTPLVESIPGDEQSSLVTFLWPGKADTDHVVIIGGVAGTNLPENKMIHLANSDLWYKTYKVRNDARFVYSLSPNDSMIPIEKIDPKDRAAMHKRLSELQPDPLNPLHDPGGMPSSYVELPGAPPQPWITHAADVPKGRVEKLRFQSTILNNDRDVWVYTPPKFANSGPAYPLLVVFDGLDYVDTIPVPVILDNLIAHKVIAPMVAISVGNPTASSRAVELTCSPAFADFLVKELVPWMQKHYHATKDAKEVVVGGSSFGGLAAAFAGFMHPEVFGNVLSQSGSFWWAPDNASEPEWLTKQFASSPRQPIRIFLEAGLMETGASLTGPSILQSNRNLRGVLMAKDYDVSYHEFNGGHEPLNWRGSFGNGLQYLIGSSQQRRAQ